MFQARELISVGAFQLFPSQRLLMKDDRVVKLGGRAFDILLALAERPGEVVSQRELITRVWPNVFVEEVSLRVQIAALRKALEDKADGTRYLANIPGRGYSLVAPTSRTTIDEIPEQARVTRSAYALPPPLAGMVGRDEQVREICEKLTSTRFVSIVGTGGVGKTTVARSVAHALLQEFSGAVCFVELSPVGDPKLLIAAIASAFGLPVQSEDALPELMVHLRGKRVLLVLDSCEHLIAEAARVGQRLFDEAPSLYILVTSREALRLGAEHLHLLPSLTSPPEDQRLTANETMAYPAAQLFVERMVSAGFGDRLNDEDARSVAEICRKLGGIALAIELAAGRAAVLGIGDTAALINSQFALLWPGRRTAPPRHQTLNATLDWSYNLLSEVECVLLCWLSVFAGAFSVQASRQVASERLGADQADEAFGGLLAKFLLSADLSGPTARYRLLDTTRAYADRKLKEAGERATAQRTHALYYHELLRAATRSDSASELSAYVSDLDEIRAALRWAFDDGGDALVGADIAAYSAPLWLDKGLLTECQAWMAKAAAACTDGSEASTLQQSHIQNAFATAELFTNGYSSETMAAWARTLERAEALGELPTQYLAHLIIWSGEIRAALYADAIRTSERCIAVAAGASDQPMLAMGEWMLGHTLHHAGRFEEARNHLERYFALETDAARFSIITIGYDRYVDALCIFSNVLWMQGHADEGIKCVDRALAEAQSHGSAIPITFAMLWRLLDLYLMEPDADVVEHEAVELLEQSRAHKIDSDSGFALCVMGLGQANRGEFDAGVRLVTEGLRVLSETQVEVFHALFLAHVCEVALASGRLNDAVFWMSELDRMDHDRDHWSSAEVLRIKGLLAAAQGSAPDAETHLLNAIDLARRQRALPWELRATTSLSRLWAERHRGRDALTILETALGKFTEGHASTDLLKANRLIDKLKASLDNSERDEKRKAPGAN